MPCRSGYMERGRNEKEFQQTAINYQYALEAMGKTVPKTVKDSAKEYYCGTDFTLELCGLVRSMDSEQSNTIVFNGRDSRARQLADWWEDHEEVDRKREEKIKPAVDKFRVLWNSLGSDNERSDLKEAIQIYLNRVE